MIEVKVEKIDFKDILSFKYNGIVFHGEMGSENGALCTLLPEKAISELMNLCMVALRDLKTKRIREEVKEQPIRFIGVDYR